MKYSQPWFVDKKIQQAQYMNKINGAVLSGRTKDFLRYIASKATWKHTTQPEKSYTGCYATHDTIEIQMGRSKDYVAKAKREALKFGWIVVLKRQGSSDQIFPVIGENDPSIKPKVKRERWVGRVPNIIENEDDSGMQG